MPTTDYSSAALSVATIGARTDSDGEEVADLSAEENRLVLSMFRSGRITEDAFAVRASTPPGMTVLVGSGYAKRDLFLVEGTAPGQGNYVVRLDVPSVELQIPAADPSQGRFDEIYLVVREDVYDSSGHALPQIAYRKGDPSASPEMPGPDSSWTAWARLGFFSVLAGATVHSGILGWPRTTGMNALVEADMLNRLIPQAHSVRLNSDHTTGILAQTLLGSGRTSPAGGFTFTVPAGEMWAFDMYLIVLSESPAKPVFSWTSLGGEVTYYSLVTQPSDVSTPTGAVAYRAWTIAGAPSFTVGGGNGTYLAVRIQGVSIASTGSTGGFSLNFASNTLGGDVTVKRGSWMRVTKL